MLPPEQSSTTLPPGATVGNYQVLAVLGEGGSSTVYRAVHIHVRREVALKVLDPAYPRERFLAEARAIGSISPHPNIVEVFDTGKTEDGHPYYVMELLQGQDLSRVLADRTLSAEEALPYLEQVCAGLEAAHRAGVIHRDIKQSNIFAIAGAKLQLKIFDFGIARLPELLRGADMAATSHGMVFGTPASMSPEQAAGEPDRIGPHSDIYSLGVMLYQMLAGHPPFDDDNVAQLLRRHIRDEPPPLAEAAPSAPRGVCDVIHRCLAKRPEDRYASAQELYEAFAAAVVDELEERGEELPHTLQPPPAADPLATTTPAQPALASPPETASADHSEQGAVLLTTPASSEPSFELHAPGAPTEPSFELDAPGAATEPSFELDGTGLPTGALERVRPATNRERGGRHSLVLVAGFAVLLAGVLWLLLRDGDAPAPTTIDAGQQAQASVDAGPAEASAALDAAIGDGATAAADLGPDLAADQAVARPTPKKKRRKKRARAKKRQTPKKRATKPSTPPAPTPAPPADPGPPTVAVPPVGEVLDVDKKQ